MSLIVRFTSQLKKRFLNIGQRPDPTAQMTAVLDTLLTKHSSDHRGLVTMMIEIDNFADLRRHHSAPDIARILAVLEQRLEGSVLARDQVRRLDGAQYCCILSPLHGYSEDDVLVLAGQIQALIAVPVIARDLNATVTVSIGCVVGGVTLLNSGTAILEAAHIAQIEAASKGTGNLRFYDPALGEKIRLRRALALEAHDALASGAIMGYFQPQISLTTGAITGFEALARWHHDTQGLLGPAAFLPVLEKAGLMRILGRVILKNALRTLRAWDQAGLNVPRVSVNMCAEELRQPDLTAEIADILKDHALTPDRLCIEVLETVAIGEAGDPIAKNLQALSALGCQIDLDDFGTGITSIKSIQAFSIDRIKIDRSFISALDHDHGQQRVVKTILSMAHDLRVDTLAEGVETQQELTYLTTTPCSHAQGYVISYPLPAADATAWMRARQNPSAQHTSTTAVH